MSVTKIYTSRVVPHFSVGSRRVAFSATSAGGSYFRTNDEELQKAMERHPWFKTKFALKSVIESEPVKAAQKVASDGDGVAVAAESAGDVKAEMETKTFATLADAKNWLAEQFGVARTSIRTQSTAIDVGKANGVLITFSGAKK